MLKPLSIHCITFAVDCTRLDSPFTVFLMNCFILSYWPVAVYVVGSLFIGLNCLYC